MKKAALLGILGLWVSVFPGCGGSNGPTTPTPTPTPAQVTTTLLAQGFSLEASPDTDHAIVYSGDLNVPYAGSVTVSFDWTFPTSNLDLVVTRNDCTDPGGAYYATCSVLGADRTARKPASTTFNMTAAGTIRIWIFNFATVPESGVVNVTILH